LNILVDSNLGGKIGSICCCAPICADDIALACDNPIDLQSLVNIVYDYSQREEYMLQPQKSVILPVNTNNKISFDKEEWFMNDNIMPVTTTTPHIGIQRDSQNTCLNTIENNLKKSRRALYSLMHTGLPGENGLDPTTYISLLRTFDFPIMLYGLETLLPSGKNLELLNKQHKKIIKQVLSLPTNVANPSIYILSGLLPVEVEIHKKALNLFGNICRSSQDSIEWRVAEGQLGLKNMKSHSWFVDIKKLFIKYELENPYEYLLCSDYTKLKWKIMINKKSIYTGLREFHLKLKCSNHFNTLVVYFESANVIQLQKTCTANRRDISRIPVRLKIATGSYILQTKRASCI